MDINEFSAADIAASLPPNILPDKFVDSVVSAGNPRGKFKSELYQFFKSMSHTEIFLYIRKNFKLENLGADNFGIYCFNAYDVLCIEELVSNYDIFEYNDKEKIIIKLILSNMKYAEIINLIYFYCHDKKLNYRVLNGMLYLLMTFEGIEKLSNDQISVIKNKDYIYNCLRSGIRNMLDTYKEVLLEMDQKDYYHKIDIVASACKCSTI